MRTHQPRLIFTIALVAAVAAVATAHSHEIDNLHALSRSIEAALADMMETAQHRPSGAVGVDDIAQLRRTLETAVHDAIQAARDSDEKRRLQADESKRAPHNHGHSFVSQVLGLTPRDLRKVEDLLAAERRELPRSALRPINSSRSILQYAFVQLHSFLYARAHLPLSEWGESTPRGPWIGWDTFDSETLSRRAFKQFLTEHAGLVARNATCLGWDDVRYVRLIPRCMHSQRQAFKYSAHWPADLVKEARGAPAGVLKGDLSALTHVGQLGASAGTFDLILCNQVFEHVAQPFAGARTLFHLLKPGGLIFWTAPFIERFHLVPNDFFRYTLNGAAEIFRSAGFKIVAQYQVGDSAIASGYAMGFGAGDFDPEYLKRRLLIALPNASAVEHAAERGDRWLYVSVALVVRRP